MTAGVVDEPPRHTGRQERDGHRDEQHRLERGGQPDPFGQHREHEAEDGDQGGRHHDPDDVVGDGPADLRVAEHRDVVVEPDELLVVGVVGGGVAQTECS